MRKLIALSTLGLSLLLLFAFFNLANAAALLPGQGQPSPDAPDQAHIIVQFSPTDRLVRQVQFTSPISGLAALQQSGLVVTTKQSSFGPFICSIEGVGRTIEDCDKFLPEFWGYSFWDGKTWQDYPVGAVDSKLTDGSIDGWRWGQWGVGSIPSATAIISASQALEWLKPRQNISNGSYDNIGYTVEMLYSIGANHLKAADWKRQAGSPSLQDYILRNAAAFSGVTGASAGKAAVALTAASYDACWPADLREPMDYYSPTTGSMGYGAGFQSWAILGTVALSESVPANAVENLKAMQQPDGGWEWMPNFLSDSNSTALAIQALIAAGESITSSEVISGLTYLKSIQNTDGGFPYTPGVDPKSDGNSTAYAIQAILAAGQDPITGTWKISDTNPVSFLLSLRLPDGSFKWQTVQTAANQLVTQQAVVALLGRPFPIRKAARGPACSTVYLPLTLSKTP